MRKPAILAHMGEKRGCDVLNLLKKNSIDSACVDCFALVITAFVTMTLSLFAIVAVYA